MSKNYTRGCFKSRSGTKQKFQVLGQAQEGSRRIRFMDFGYRHKHSHAHRCSNCWRHHGSDLRPRLHLTLIWPLTSPYDQHTTLTSKLRDKKYLDIGYLTPYFCWDISSTPSTLRRCDWRRECQLSCIIIGPLVHSTLCSIFVSIVVIYIYVSFIRKSFIDLQFPVVWLFDVVTLSSTLLVQLLNANMFIVLSYHGFHLHVFLSFAAIIYLSALEYTLARLLTYLMAFIALLTWWPSLLCLLNGLHCFAYLMAFIALLTWWLSLFCLLDGHHCFAYLMAIIALLTWWPSLLCLLDGLHCFAHLMAFIALLTWWPSLLCLLDGHHFYAYLMGFIALALQNVAYNILAQ